MTNGKAFPVPLYVVYGENNAAGAGDDKCILATVGNKIGKVGNKIGKVRNKIGKQATSARARTAH